MHSGHYTDDELSTGSQFISPQVYLDSDGSQQVQKIVVVYRELEVLVCDSSGRNWLLRITPLAWAAEWDEQVYIQPEQGLQSQSSENMAQGMP